jgi:hypothetical protein
LSILYQDEVCLLPYRRGGRVCADVRYWSAPEF